MLRFLQITDEHQDRPVFIVLLTITTFFAKTSRTSRPLLEGIAPVNDFRRTGPSGPRNMAASEIGNGVAMTTPMSL